MDDFSLSLSSLGITGQDSTAGTVDEPRATQRRGDTLSPCGCVGSLKTTARATKRP